MNELGNTSRNKKKITCLVSLLTILVLSILVSARNEVSVSISAEKSGINTVPFINQLVVVIRCLKDEMRWLKFGLSVF